MSVFVDWLRTKKEQFGRVAEAEADRGSNFPAACFGVAGGLACSVMLFAHGDYASAIGGFIISVPATGKLIQALNNG